MPHLSRNCNHRASTETQYFYSKSICLVLLFNGIVLDHYYSIIGIPIIHFHSMNEFTLRNASQERTA